MNFFKKYHDLKTKISVKQYNFLYRSIAKTKLRSLNNNDFQLLFEEFTTNFGPDYPNYYDMCLVRDLFEKEYKRRYKRSISIGVVTKNGK